MYMVFWSIIVNVGSGFLVKIIGFTKISAVFASSCMVSTFIVIVSREVFARARANYKGRFRYGLWEHSPVWRTLDRKVGVFSLVVDFVLSIAIVLVLSAFIDLAFDVGTESALAFVLFGAIGWTFVNMAMDKISVEGFEKNCLKCNHKEECMNFHHENCSIEAVKQRLKSAISYEKIRKQKKCAIRSKT